MRSHRTTWSLVFGLVGLAACAPSGDGGAAVMTDADRAAIEEQLYQMESDWVAANESGDVSVLDRLFAEDFIYTIDDGTLYLKEAFIALAGAPASGGTDGSGANGCLDRRRGAGRIMGAPRCHRLLRSVTPAMNTRSILLLVFAAILFSGMSPAWAAPEGTGLPLPRFVQLRAGEVNMRTGPGVQYPVDWVSNILGELSID